MKNFILHYAPDNASLCIRLALDTAGIPFETRLVDRASRAQKSPAYRAMNPNGLIPVLETPDGALFETAAILLWLADRHPALLPHHGSERAEAVKWLIWMSNTLHPTLRMLFYPDQYIAKDACELLSKTTRERLTLQLEILNKAVKNAPWVGGETPTIVDCYLCPMLRWIQLYPTNSPQRPDLKTYPNLFNIAHTNEAYPSTSTAITAEGLGPTPFSAPSYPNPPEGSAT